MVTKVYGVCSLHVHVLIEFHTLLYPPDPRHVGLLPPVHHLVSNTTEIVLTGYKIIILIGLHTYTYSIHYMMYMHIFKHTMY